MKKIAACGNDCSYCHRYAATKTGNIQSLKRVAELWNRMGWRSNIEHPENMRCHGCGTSDYCKYDISDCAKEMNVQNCGQCSQYPCYKIENAVIKTKAYREACEGKCSFANYRCLKKAFFCKKDNLDESYKIAKEAHSKNN